ncbi:MAG TPA: glycosyltransferase, partial [Brevundimonas sp.]|nr:glycosyltransferase [Brevundimonas sp.]
MDYQQAGTGSARITLTRAQAISIGFVFTLGVIAVAAVPRFAGWLLISTQAGFLTLAAWRLGLIAVQASAPKAASSAGWRHEDWPRYTIVAALYHEAQILPHLVERLDAIDYPRDRLQGFLALEADDHATIAAASQLKLPDWLSV